MTGERQLRGRREDRDPGRLAGHLVDKDRLAEAELVCNDLATVGDDRPTVEEDAEWIPAAAVGPEEDAQDVELGHRRCASMARSTAARCTAMTVSASVIRPSSVIASTSSNGIQRTSSASVPSGLATPGVRPVAR